MTIIRRCLILLIFASTFFSAHAGNATVSTCDFPSLVRAIAIANTGGGVVDFTCSGTIPFFDTITITNRVTINAGGAVTFDGMGKIQLLYIDDSAIVTVDGVTLINGAGYEGGAIYNLGDLTITHSTFSHNISEIGGGAVYNLGTVSITHSIFTDNIGMYGGAIYNLHTMSISTSAFFDNVGLFSGGAIDSAETLTIRNSLFYRNSAKGLGGAIASSQTISINHAQFRDNSAHWYGGAFFNNGEARLRNSIFTHNITQHGGAIFASSNRDTNTMSIQNTVFDYNVALLSGGALLNEYHHKTTLMDSLFSHNIAPAGGAIDNGSSYNGTDYFGYLISTNTYFIHNACQHVTIDDGNFSDSASVGCPTHK